MNLITMAIRSFNKLVALLRQTENVTLVISLHKLGDTAFTVPALKQIIRTRKNVIILCYPESSEIYSLVFDIPHILADKKEIVKGRIAGRSLRKRIRKIKPDEIIDLTGHIRGITSSLFTGADNILGFNRKYYTHNFRNISEIGIRHLMDLYLGVVDSRLDEKEKQKLKYIPPSYNSEDIVLLHPFAGWEAKEWDLRKFINLASLLNGKIKSKLVFPAGYIQEDVLSELRLNGIDFNETHNINELIDLIKSCSLLIGNDSGPVYIAYLLGKPTFSLYGPTNPEFSFPPGEHHFYYQGIAPCSPASGQQYCFTFGGRKGCPSYECMRGIGTEIVFGEILKVMKKLDIG